MEQRITIGRAPGNTIHIDGRWDMVSNDHAEIVREGNNYVFIDHSSNGTYINGQKVQNKQVNIYPEYKIVLANQFELEWDVILRYLPKPVEKDADTDRAGRKTVNRYQNGQSSSKQTERFDRPVGGGLDVSNVNHAQSKELFGQANEYSQAEIDEAIGKWNWGAFFCTWIWAVCHKTYWPLLILVVAWIPYIGQVCSISLCVYLGLKGSRIAWNSGRYDDFGAYKKAQKNWAIVGIILFILSIALSAFSVYSVLSAI